MGHWVKQHACIHVNGGVSHPAWCFDGAHIVLGQVSGSMVGVGYFSVSFLHFFLFMLCWFQHVVLTRFDISFFVCWDWFYTLKGSIPPQKIWNIYNIKHTCTIKFHVLDRTVYVLFAWVFSTCPCSNWGSMTLTNWQMWQKYQASQVLW